MNEAPLSWRTLHGVTFRDGLWLAVPLLMVVLPLVPDVGVLPVGFVAFGVLAPIVAGWLGRALPGWLRWVVLLLGVGAVYQTHGAFTGMEPGMALLLVLIATKLIELRTPREYRMVCILGFFLVLCGLFFSQDFALCMYEGLVFFLLTLVLQRFHGGPAEEAPGARQRLAELWAVGRAVLIALLQALPVVLILFAFFPRAPAGFGMQFLRRNVTGMSDHLAPGEVEKLVEDGSPAFRARFIRGNPGSGPFYWRGVVLWDAGGLEWRRGLDRDPAPTIPERQVNRPVEQEIVVEPHGGHWLFSLDQPLAPPEGERLLAGRYLTSRRPIDYRKLYRVVSGPLREPLDPMRRRQALVVPQDLPPRVRELAASWVGTPREKVSEAIRYFSRNYVYTLEAGSYPGNDGWAMLETFLFERKRGFCSHYAAAFASLMRISGIPSRVIMGYFGGEYNPVGNFYAISQADAHAWCEVWLEEDGWVRIDPTLFVPGGRRNPGAAAAARDPASATLEPERPPRRVLEQMDFLQELRFQWAAFNYDWTVWVLGYDRDVQQAFFNKLGFARLSRGIVFLWALVAVGLFYLALRWYLKWRAAPRVDELTRAYRHLCARLAAVGLPRGVAEPPAAYGARVIAARPDLRATLEPLFEAYTRLLYAPWKEANPTAAERKLIRELLFTPIQREQAER